MRDNIIGSVNRIGGEQSQISDINKVGRLQPSLQAEKTESTIRAGSEDSVYLSAESREKDSDKAGNFEALKSSICSIKEQLQAQPSGNDATSGLINTSMTARMEKNRQGNAKPSARELGFEAGTHGVGTFSSRGLQDGYDTGMQKGGTFSSRHVNPYGAQPGGGTASPNMVKLQTDYSQALKNGDTISPAAENSVLSTFADAGKNEKPIKSLLGIES